MTLCKMTRYIWWVLLCISISGEICGIRIKYFYSIPLMVYGVVIKIVCVWI